MDSQLSTKSEDEPLDLAQMRDLLSLLKEFNVQGFTQGDFAITFARDLDPDLVSVNGRRVKSGDDDDEVEITGFSKPKQSLTGFRNPGLWQEQGGKPYSFTADS